MFKIQNRVIENAGWLIGCKISQSILTLFITMLSARLLGPSNYGLINYAASLVAFITPLMQLGFASVIVHELVSHEEQEGVILGTALLSNFICSFFCIAGLLCFVAIANKGEFETLIVTFLYSLVLLSNACEIIGFWFQAHLMSKYTSLISFFAYFLTSIYKFILLITEQSIYLFALSNVLDSLIIAGLQFFLYKRFSGKKLLFSKIVFWRIFKQSKYYIVSGLMISVFSQTDRVMLKILISDQAVGYYSAAVTCAGITGFIFTALIQSFTPVIYQAKLDSERNFVMKVKLLFSVVIYGALAQSIVITILADFIVGVIYGNSYAATIPALRIIVWSTMFSYLGAVRNRWLLAEKKQRYLLFIDTSGAFINIVLNYILIPKWGINGAAFATLMTELLTNIVITSCIVEIRKVVRLMFESINPKLLVETVFRLVRQKY